MNAAGYLTFGSAAGASLTEAGKANDGGATRVGPLEVDTLISRSGLCLVVAEYVGVSSARLER